MSEPDRESADRPPVDEPDALEAGTGTPTQLGASALDDATRVAGGAVDRVRAEVDTRTTEAGDRLERIANDLRVVADGLAGQGEEQPARLASEAARQSDRLGTYLRASDSDRLLADSEEFIRRQPAAAAAGAALAGFVAARFLKASANRRQRLRMTPGSVGSGEVMTPPGADPLPTAPAADPGAPTVHGRP